MKFSSKVLGNHGENQGLGGKKVNMVYSIALIIGRGEIPHQSSRAKKVFFELNADGNVFYWGHIGFMSTKAFTASTKKTSGDSFLTMASKPRRQTLEHVQ